MSSEQAFNAGLSSSQHQPGQMNVTDTSEQSNFSKPPMGQKSTVPPLQGQQNVSNSSLPEQQNLSNPIMPGQTNLSGPPLSNQQTYNSMIMQGAHGQNLTGPSKQNLSNPLLQTQQTLSGPPLSTPPLPPGHYSSLQGQKSSHSFLEPQNISTSNLSGPPLMNQQNIHPSLVASQQSGALPLLTNQQSFNKPPLLGQTVTNSQMLPPLPSQSVGQMINSGTNLLQTGQRPYTSGPPVPGQHMGNPLGISRNPSSAMPNYQHTGYQGYNNVRLFLKYFENNNNQVTTIYN